MPHQSVNGISLFYKTIGQGPPLVLIPGLGTGGWLFNEQVEAFAEAFTVICVDNRGSGQSETPAGPYSIQQMSADVAELLTALQIDSANFLGVSMGGFIAMECALTYPRLVKKLVLAATHCGGTPEVPMTEETLQQLISPGDGSRAGLRKKLALAFSEKFMRSDHIDALIEQRLAYPQSRAGFDAQVAAGTGFDRCSDVDKITAKTLLLGATGDRLVPIDNVKRLHRLVNNSQLVVYEGFGHQFLVENAQVFNKDVLQFLGCSD